MRIKKNKDFQIEIYAQRLTTGTFHFEKFSKYASIDTLISISDFTGPFSFKDSKFNIPLQENACVIYPIKLAKHADRGCSKHFITLTSCCS